ncbi:unnamed protein product [Caenorhabditis auriculariae]|uniref:Chromodomain-helicase-DNA-binding protein 1 n=1 Tax=Caenorhabditis auriculariae TaxID=2777116 RepID=A0A8S1GMC8_9PELO|nr:unnamed protein product [Caenorhabditis auriculariae]
MWRDSGSSSEDSEKDVNGEPDNFLEKCQNGLSSSGENREGGARSSSSDSGAAEKDSEYEQSDQDGAKSAQSSASSAEKNDEESSDEYEQAKARKRGMDKKTKKLLEDENLLRRSQRAKPNKSNDSESEDQRSGSEDGWSDSGSKKRKTRKLTRKTKAKNKVIRRVATKVSVDYTEKSTDEDVDEDDVLEWEDEKSVVPDASVSGSNPSECVERIIKWRTGVSGATGSQTTCYNVAEKGDPNEADGEKKEPQFLIKWIGWSHMHNTWESEGSLLSMGAKGIKRVHNFIKRQQDIDSWRRTADKEYIEFFDCEQVMAEELCEEYKIVERIVAHQCSREKAADGSETTEYFVKWNGLPYSECTWEDEKLLPKEKIDEYHTRLENCRTPCKTAQVLRKRPRFVKMEEMPSFLKPNERRQELRDYQLEGLNWMLHAWSKHNSSILADEMGLGKTIQSISFLAALFHRHDLAGPFLVVVPLSTMAAWQKEFAQWAPAINLVTYMGDVVSREQIRQYEWYLGGTKKMKINAILTTYEILLKDKSFLGSVDWAALLVDEAHRLKNDESLLYKCLKDFRCNHRLLITGTPLQNSLKELWALLHFIMPDKFESWEQFEQDHNDKDHKGISALHRKLEPFLLRRVKKDVEKSLPPKLEQILRVDMTAMQKQYYKWILTKNYRELSKGVKGSINGFVNLVMELKKCCNHTSLIRQYDNIESDAQARLQQLLKSSGKLILLDKLLCRLYDTGHRVLIFSQMVMMLDVLQEYLQLRRFPSQRLDGSMRADMRKQALDHFNAEGSTDFAFLLSTRAGGLGINLATADTVIIFDSDWNPQNDLQAMSRAHRIGQTRQVNIYRLVTKGSVEEEIVERAKQKLVLDHLVIQRMDTTGKTVLSKSSATGSVPFDKHELNAILKFGAAELFKEKEGEEQEPEVDIDRILMGAETREAEDAQGNDNELLNSFKYATFAFDEEKDIAAATREADNAEWDAIIPEEDRRRIEDEEKMKALAEINLAPRVRTKALVPLGAQENGSSSSEDEDGGKKKKKKPFGDFSTQEIKRFVRSIRKFAQPLERLEALAQDAELEEHSTGELHRLVEALLEGCAKAAEEYKKKEKDEDKKENEKKDKGPNFKFAGVEVNVKQIMKSHEELEPLHAALSEPSKASSWQPPRSARPQKGWDVDWTWVDDGAVLWGIYKYGLCSWEAIKLDPQLGLADKIFIKDKSKKPQPKHLQQRVDYLLKLMKNPTTNNEKRRTTGPERVERKRKMENDKEKDKNARPLEKKKREETKVKKDAARGDKSFSDQLQLLIIDKSLYAAALEDRTQSPFSECVKLCQPVHKYMKKLNEALKAHNEADEAKYILRLGDSFKDSLEQLMKRKPNTNLRKWYNYLWIFLCKFVPREPAELADRYRSLCSLNKHKHHKDRSPHQRNHKDGKEKPKHHSHHHHHHHQQKDKKEPNKKSPKKHRES